METTLRKFHENPRMQRGPKIHKEELWKNLHGTDNKNYGTTNKKDLRANH
jgi:hypothetical protein